MTSNNVDGEWLDDLLNHLVVREGNGPNGAGGDIRYWKNGLDLPAKQVILARLAQAYKKGYEDGKEGNAK